jgi:hypothetical protein
MSTIKNQVEQIRQVFPNVMENQVIKDLNIKQKDFVLETEYLETYAQLMGMEDSVSWELPDDYNSFIELLPFDVNDKSLYFGDYQLDYEIVNNILYIKSTWLTPIIKIPDAIDTIYLGYRNAPADLSVITDEWSVKDEHIDGVISRVYEEYYAKYPVDVMTRTGEIIKARDTKMVQYWQMKVKENLIKAKRYVIKRKQIDLRGAINYGMAGKFVLPAHSAPPITGDIVILS